MTNAGLMTVDVSATVSGAEGTAIDPAPGPEATEVKTVATKAGNAASAMTGLDSVPSGPGGPVDSASTGAAVIDQPGRGSPAMPSGAPQAYEGAQSVEAKHVTLTGTTNKSALMKESAAGTAALMTRTTEDEAVQDGTEKKILHHRKKTMTTSSRKQHKELHCGRDLGSMRPKEA